MEAEEAAAGATDGVAEGVAVDGPPSATDDTWSSGRTNSSARLNTSRSCGLDIVASCSTVNGWPVDADDDGGADTDDDADVDADAAMDGAVVDGGDGGGCDVRVGT